MNTLNKVRSYSRLSLPLLIVALVMGSSQALAAGGVVKSPTGVAPDRYVYPIIA